MKNWLRLMCAVLFAGLCTMAQAQTLLVVGDSISAAYGIEIEQGWVARLQQRLDERGSSYQVVNASISGDTSAGGRARLPALLERHRPALTIIELGGNDGLRGLPLERLQDNLGTMVEQARQQGSEVILLGMRIPPNYGPRYTEGFYQVYQQLAQELDVPVLDFFLEGVGGVEGMIQSDGIHPTAAAQPLLLDNAWPLIEAGLQGPAE
ncbi:acyl-CoA thioesterase-1 [Thiopseudomonas denitrificans]|uniref:Acyl-CoA thioesterase-1 n=2 Tax=Thiopseudomonas denitrificans TaxID=1501432 RepID=A0A4R6TZH9_9GAMM|nr:arylesterase [Thiopseudomonas denitrificans]TDQ39408.1 acyl-CoA thioesterase-1 [Thiopseudomonas denitrificans]